MPQPKKVAIIGAGPSGLVTAKTLLHDFPGETFAPTVFEKRHVVGGLWPTDGTANTITSGLIDPQMRTNLSRFTVSFSDFPWEVTACQDGDGDGDGDVGNVQMFPRAWQVGRYLVHYAERYLPSGVVRLGREVVGVHWGESRWDVRWVEGGREHTEPFDYLIVASGYFASPYRPKIPGLDAAGEQTGLVVEHSSAVNNATEIDRVLAQIDTSNKNKTNNNTDEQSVNVNPKSRKKIVVIGASMSGVETASALALHLSSTRLSRTTSSDTQPNTETEYEIHHVCSRPFWTVPYYLPHGNTIVPLDLAFYDMDRRPPGEIEYGFGPISSQQVNKTNEYFRRLLGAEYEQFGSVGVQRTATATATATDNEDENVSPSWTAIGDDYAEYIRSGMITTTLGRVIAVHPCEQGDRTRLDIRHRGSDDVVSMEDVSAIILATGFTPYTALSFLPEDVLSRLELSNDDPFIPLILDGKGTSNATVPGLGFVGFYRGPYWGVMEMQARSLGQTWSRAIDEARLAEENVQREQERKKLRDLRCVKNRSQFPMGDYVGLMESFAREMGIKRVPFQGSGSENDGRGPVVPARYVVGKHTDSADATLKALSETSSPTPGGCTLAAATAVFRALHGSWSHTTTEESSGDGHGRATSGVSTFYPRYASSPEYEKEYVCEIKNEGVVPTRSIYQLSAGSSRAEVFVITDDATRHQRLGLKFSHYRMDEEGAFILALGHPCPKEGDQDKAEYKYRYAFRLDGVAISSWECTISSRAPERTTHTRTVYTRPT